MRYNVYLMIENTHKECKIGLSRNPETRLKEIRTGRPRTVLAYVKYVESLSEARNLECELHHKFQHLHLDLEWFQYTEEIEKYFSTEFFPYQLVKQLPKSRKPKKVIYGDKPKLAPLRTTWWGEIIPYHR